MRFPVPRHLDLHARRPHLHSLENVLESSKDAVVAVTKTLMGREAQTDSSSSDPSSTCAPNNNSAICQKPVSESSYTIPIVLGAVIPICCAFIAFIVLHRRFLKRQRLEDAKDAHRSLDFGVEPSMQRSKKNRTNQKVPEMTVTDLSGGKKGPRGLSMDMNLNSPYLLPAGLQGSHESIHSMSRSVHDEHDPYRPVTMMRTSSDTTRPRQDDASLYSASTKHSTTDKSTLLANAQRMSQSYPKRLDSASQHDVERGQQPPNPPRNAPQDFARSGQTYNDPGMPPAIPHKHSLPSPPPPPAPASNVILQDQRSPSPAAVRPPRKSSMSSTAARQNPPWDAQQDMQPPPPPPMPAEFAPQSPYDHEPDMVENGRYSIDAPNLSEQYLAAESYQHNRLSVMGMRPLPPDQPDETPEARANRIRSFYKEYFDDSRRGVVDSPYAQDMYGSDGASYDPETGGFAMPGGSRPFAQPIGRRAMTPPPRGAPRPGESHGRHFSTMTGGRASPRPRPGPAPPHPKIRAPPPKPLHDLPTPHLLRDYDSVISAPIDFAPPTSFRQVQNGSAPASPRGGLHPYSPAVKAFNPLASSFDDLSAIPSPHHLRKSGTFTSLDFAPPGRFKDFNDAASETGSIRSARSGISALQLDAVRAGAYRVSRIPKEIVTSREDLAMQLKPKWNLTTPA